MNIFYILGLDYTFLQNGTDNNLNPEDILLLYIGNDTAEHYIHKSKKTIIIRSCDKLFGENYLKAGSIPEKIRKYDDIISIFSRDTDLYIKKQFNDKRAIETNIDIISDIFFMLTRYEEVVNVKANNDEPYHRFPAKSSVALNNNFLNRPIVNEHIDLIWKFISYFSLGYKRKKWWNGKDFAACLTHDVDEIQKYQSFTDVTRTAISLSMKYKKPIMASKIFMNYLKGYKNDPFYGFDFIMNLEQAYDFKSSFYFMSGGNSEFDNRYNIFDEKIKNIIEQIENAGFEAGYHGSFNSYIDLKTFKQEKDKLEFIIKKKEYGGRQHFLRFNIPCTWRVQEKAGLLYDTTLGFAEAEGFRCGMCFPYRPYDLLKNKILNIWEIPLIVMDGSLKAYRAYTPEKGLEETINLINTVKKHSGVFTILYHNSFFDYTDDASSLRWKKTYEETMEYLYKNNCLGTSGSEIISMIVK